MTTLARAGYAALVAAAGEQRARPEPAADAVRRGARRPRLAGRRAALAGPVRHPLGPLLGAGSFMLTLVWVMTEFLCLAVYQQAHSGDPDALAPASWRCSTPCCSWSSCLHRRCSPAPSPAGSRRRWRSVLFPLGALLSLLLARWREAAAELDGPGRPRATPTPRPPRTALFDPVHASNFAAVPLRFQARLRAVSEGDLLPVRAWRRAAWRCCMARQRSAELVLLLREHRGVPVRGGRRLHRRSW